MYCLEKCNFCIISRFISQRNRDKPFIPTCVCISVDITLVEFFVHFSRKNEHTVFDRTFPLYCIRRRTVVDFLKLKLKKYFRAVMDVLCSLSQENVCTDSDEIFFIDLYMRETVYGIV